ncbi:MAG TPA: hypothetical protein VK486_09200 [Thermoleophilaceae bacterium]|nr:hypothetical protein [Thermoleophilaceae bacterium]
MQITGLSAEDIEAGVARAQARADDALSEYEAAKAELAWWLQGLRLVDPHGADAVEAAQDPASVVTELFPDVSVFKTGARPTLRQAVALIMRDYPHRVWPIGDLTLELQDRGWLDQHPEAQKRVSDLAAVMYNAGQLSRLGRGVYKLSPPVEAELDAARGGRQ